MTLLPYRPPAAIGPFATTILSTATLERARAIVDDVRRGGEPRLRGWAEALGDIAPGGPLWLGPDVLANALRRLPSADRDVLERTASRIASFAETHRSALVDVELAVPGGTAGVTYRAVSTAGCYAPGGRYPLPSSVLMTGMTARAAGVSSIWVASPRPTDVTLAAAAIVGAQGLLAVGGAQAIAALAYGVGRPACDVVVGPGNRFVTAAKSLVAADVRTDGVAGPSELVVVADRDANPERIAADLLAVAEHDPDAGAGLISLSPSLLGQVREALERQLADLPSADVARRALALGWSTEVSSWRACAALCDRVAPEHLELHVADAATKAIDLRHYGCLFVGEGAAEVAGDYGVGPNHVLPTGGSARRRGGLSVLDFLGARTWLKLDDARGAQPVYDDAAAMARIEGLEGHARAADLRRRPSDGWPDDITFSPPHHRRVC
jgi:phosphoribosyl-ATP pyrophosphohydrolase/phosphoribosyl-AMP cyclohydrolase/histidinol dehydrogenase